MEQYIQNIDIRWSDLDPNFHLRHSVYYDYGAFCRVSFLNANGITPDFMSENKIGPILFREECVFRKEVRLGEELTIDMNLVTSSSNYSRWTIRHHLTKKDGVLAAVLTVDGAWIDVVRRKLCTPPEHVLTVFNEMPRVPEFTFLK
ncbi:MAG: acyl-CoA thioesterase [Flavitalea sp.]